MVFISAREEPAERWCVANECRKACGCKAGIFVFLDIKLMASHIVFLEICPVEEVLEGNRNESLSMETLFCFKYSPIAWYKRLEIGTVRKCFAPFFFADCSVSVRFLKSKFLHLMLQASETLNPASNIKSTITLCLTYLIESRTILDSSLLM